MVADEMNTGFSWWPLILFASLWLVWHLLPGRIDSHEPVVIQPRMPVIGHLLGFFNYGLRYFDVLRLQPLPLHVHIEITVN